MTPRGAPDGPPISTADVVTLHTQRLPGNPVPLQALHLLRMNHAPCADNKT